MDSSLSSIENCNQTNLIEQLKSTNELPLANYDTTGAAMFLVVVLLWYSVGIACMLGLQIRARSETIEECARRRAKLFIQTIRDQTQRKTILEELADKQKRDKLWKIYLGETNVMQEKLNRDEALRLRNIKKQLAVIKRTRLIMNETILPTNVDYSISQKSRHSSRASSIPNLSLVENSLSLHRRSSLDQQVLERWKKATEQAKINEQLTWPNRKQLIRRHFRRYYKNFSNEVSKVNPQENDSNLQNQQRNYKFINDIPSSIISPHTVPNNSSYQKPQAINENFLFVPTISTHHVINMNPNSSKC